jgi:hypothetical protein
LALAQDDASILLYDVPSATALKVVPASQEELPRMWSDLARSNARHAWRAQQRLTASGAEAVKLLSRHLNPAKVRVAAKLLANLDADDYMARTVAESKLAARLECGEHAVELALRDLLARKPSLEAYRRAERLLHRHIVRPVCYSSDELRYIRAVAVLEHIGSKYAVALLKRLAGGAPAILTQQARAALVRLRVR